MPTVYEAALMSYLAYEIEEAEERLNRRRKRMSPEYSLYLLHNPSAMAETDLRFLFEDFYGCYPRSYKPSPKHIFSNYLAGRGWAVLKTHNQDRWLGTFCSSGYQGIAFVNYRTKEIVIAHRGTINHPENYKADIEILKGVNGRKEDAPSIITDALRFVVGIVRDKEQPESSLVGYQISQTGHSLGGFLAEFVAGYLNCPQPVMDEWVRREASWPDSLPRPFLTNPRSTDANAITFESLGSVNMLNRFEISMKNARIINYLAAPNIANTANPHCGERRQLFSLLSVGSHETPISAGDVKITLNANLEMTTGSDLKTALNEYGEHQLLRIIQECFNDSQAPEPFELPVSEWPVAKNIFLTAATTPIPGSDGTFLSSMMYFGFACYIRSQTGGVIQLEHSRSGLPQYSKVAAITDGSKAKPSF